MVRPVNIQDPRFGVEVEAIPTRAEPSELIGLVVTLGESSLLLVVVEKEGSGS